MAIEMGDNPDDLTVRVSKATDFNASLVNEDEDWDAAASLELRFDGGPTWTATIDGNEAIWSVDKALVYSDIIQAGIREVRLFYVLGTDDIYLAVGDVEVTR